jgi:hypothetical protein
MKAVLFGASGMVGQGVLRECLESDAVDSVLLVGRLRRVLLLPRRVGWGMSEADYSKVTFDLTLGRQRSAGAEPRADVHLRVGRGDRL